MSTVRFTASGSAKKTKRIAWRERLERMPGRRDEEGSSLVELAVTLPVLLMIVTGLMTFGIAINNYLLLTDATNVGARQLAVSRGQTTDPCATVSAAVYAAAPLLKQANLTFKFTLNGTSYTGATCSSTSTTTGAAGNLTQGSTATVQVTYPCTLKIYNLNSFPSCTLNAQTSEMVQ